VERIPVDASGGELVGVATEWCERSRLFLFGCTLAPASSIKLVDILISMLSMSSGGAPDDMVGK